MLLANGCGAGQFFAVGLIFAECHPESIAVKPPRESNYERPKGARLLVFRLKGLEATMFEESLLPSIGRSDSQSSSDLIRSHHCLAIGPDIKSR